MEKVVHILSNNCSLIQILEQLLSDVYSIWKRGAKDSFAFLRYINLLIRISATTPAVLSHKIQKMKIAEKKFLPKVLHETGFINWMVACKLGCLLLNMEDKVERMLVGTGTEGTSPGSDKMSERMM